MGDTWGDGRPPDEAYSRVARDLGAVTVDFAAYLDVLGNRLEEMYDSRVRPASDDERARLERMGAPLDRFLVIEPLAGSTTSLLLGRGSFEGGATAVVSLGLAVDEPVPACFCDACDEDSESLIEQMEELVLRAVRGFRELREPHIEAPENRCSRDRGGSPVRVGRHQRIRGRTHRRGARSSRSSGRPGRVVRRERDL